MTPPTSRIVIQRQTGEILAEYRVGTGEYGVGRDPTNAIPTESDHVASQHARLVIAADGMSIEDLSSTHGTFVNGQATTGAVAIGEALVKLGMPIAYVTDVHGAGVMRGLAPDAEVIEFPIAGATESGQFAEEVRRRFQPTQMVAI